MNTIQNTLSGIIPQHELKEDEYINEADGLVYCAKCHTPRQCRPNFPGLNLLPYIKCQCQTEAYEKEQAERKKQEFKEQVARMKASGLQDKFLFDYNFANDLGYNPEIRYAHSYVKEWKEMQEKSMGLLLWGDVGTGKSFFAGCIANALLEQCVPVLMTNFSRILNTLSSCYPDDRNTYIDSLNQYSLLIIDDLGIERNSDFAKEQVFNVIDSRYRSKKPLIVTTNLTLAEMKNPTQLSDKRIYDRILERCVPIQINNQNIRSLIAADSMKQAKQLLTK